MNKSFNQLAHYKQNQTYTLSHCKKKNKIYWNLSRGRPGNHGWFLFLFNWYIIITRSGQYVSNQAVLSTKKQTLTFHIENNFIYRKKYFEK